MSAVATAAYICGTISEPKSGSEIASDLIFFCKTTGSSDLDYIKARNMLVEKANEILETFEVKDKIPNFPPPEERIKI